MVQNLLLSGARQLLLDTNCFIYFFEGRQPYLSLLLPVFRRVQRRELVVFVSAISEGELLVQGYRNQDSAAVERIKDLLSEDGFYVIAADRRIASRGARIRGEYMRGGGDRRMGLPDAIIIATAIETGCDAIVGNDAAWRGRTEIPYVYLRDAVATQ